MDVEIGVPQTPVTLLPGVETRVRVQVHNRATAAVSVRLSVARSRTGAWSHIDPSTVELPPGESAPVDVIFRPPTNALPTSTLLPFTVQAEDLRYGMTAGRATGLLTVGAPQLLDATLTRDAAGGTIRYTLSLGNRGETPLTLRLEPRINPPSGQIELSPVAVEVPGRQSVTALVRVRPRVQLVGSTTPYTISVVCRDAAASDGLPPLATVEEAGVARPRVGRTQATVLATTLLVLVTVAVVLLGLGGLPGRARQASAKASPTVRDVRRPYALIDVFPRQDGPGGKAGAEAVLARLTQAGMPVRLVDSTTSDEVADGQAGLWVLLQDGMSTVAEVRQYCDRYRLLAPKCDIVP